MSVPARRGVETVRYGIESICSADPLYHLVVTSFRILGVRRILEALSEMPVIHGNLLKTYIYSISSMSALAVVNSREWYQSDCSCAYGKELQRARTSSFRRR